MVNFTPRRSFIAAALVSALVLTAPPLGAQDAATDKQSPSADELAKKLANPVASLISVPFQNNFDFGIGTNDGWRYTLNVQPVIPFSLNDNWNLISRTILPVVHQTDVVGSSSQSGMGDIAQSLFFSPKAPTSSGWIWGVGPVFLLPTATDDLLGGKKWGAGPSAVALKQSGPWTYGVLTNHIQSFVGENSRGDVSITLLQPFVTYALGKGQTVTFQTESTYDWEHTQWTVPLGLFYAKVMKIGPHLVSFSGGPRYYAVGADSAPDWGLRVAATLLFPK
jgi:hypothetical protein